MVDNASHDGSVEYVHQNFPDVKMFTTNQIIGGLPGAQMQESEKQKENLFSP